MLKDYIPCHLTTITNVNQLIKELNGFPIYVLDQF